jgi:hypothetical protein
MEETAMKRPAWPDFANEFAQLFAAAEQNLKLAGKIKKGRKDAQADWSALSGILGTDFFEQIRSAGIAPDLIREPPRTRKANSMKFEPETPDSLTSTEELLVHGVCKVRNNLIHGEKDFAVSGEGYERDVKLVRQALMVLQEALAVCQQARALQPGTTAA